MNSGKVGMLVTGPWDLSQLSDIDYGVQVMPTFAGSSGGHQTIAGPDNWVVFDNGDQKKQAAIDFVKWLSAPEQVKAFSLGTGDLPIRTSVGDDQAVLDELNKNVPGHRGVRREPEERRRRCGRTSSSTPRSPRRWGRRSCR